MTFSPFFFCFTSLFPSLSPSQPNVIRNILTPFATSKPSQHRTGLRRSHRRDDPIRDDLAVATIVCQSPFAMISPNRSPLPPKLSLLPSSHLLAVVAEACRHHWSLPSSLKLDRRCWSNPSDILAPSHTDASASFRRFSSHGLSTSTHTNCSPLQTPATLRLPLQPVTLRLPFKLFFFS